MAVGVEASRAAEVIVGLHRPQCRLADAVGNPQLLLN